jgi:hypothetical protein
VVKPRIPGVYLVRPTVWLCRIARQRVSYIDEAELIGCITREVREHVMKQIDHAGSLAWSNAAKQREGRRPRTDRPQG